MLAPSDATTDSTDSVNGSGFTGPLWVSIATNRYTHTLYSMIPRSGVRPDMQGNNDPNRMRKNLDRKTVWRRYATSWKFCLEYRMHKFFIFWISIYMQVWKLNTFWSHKFLKRSFTTSLTGKVNGVAEVGQGKRVVLQLTEPYSSSGGRVFFYIFLLPFL